MLRNLMSLILSVGLLAIYDAPLSAIDLIDYPILTPQRLALTQAYARRHYSQDSPLLYQPKIIMIHYTEISDLEGSLKAFIPDQLPAHRDRLIYFGQVNVGTHFLVDRDGTIFSLLPTTVMARHAIGFNHTAIAVENVGVSPLTQAQLDANVSLSAFLMARHPSIEYLVGHMEYTNTLLPHYQHYIENDHKYEPHIKLDPGFEFMQQLRSELQREHPHLHLKN